MSREIVNAMFGVIEWKNGDLAFIECPGKHFHTGKNAKKDCRVTLNGAPTIFCLHTTCSPVIEEANYKMRRAIWDNNPLPKREFTEDEKVKIKKDLDEKRKEQSLREWGERNKANILSRNQWSVSDVFHESPFMSDDCTEDSDVFLNRMFSPDDVVWIGDVTDSGQPHNLKNFSKVKDHKRLKTTGNFTCPSIFKDSTYSRKNENVLKRPYLVIESDTLTRDEICSVFKWLRDSMELRAIVHTGGKSMHGWYEFPGDILLKKLKIILPEIGCDEALFKPSQPVRMPGVKRGDDMQRLFWIK